MKITTEAIYKIAKKNPNDYKFGEALKRMAEEKENSSLFWKIFYKLTRGNSQELGERIRSLVTTKKPLKKFKNILKRESAKVPHAWLKGMYTWKDKVSQEEKNLQMAGGRNF